MSKKLSFSRRCFLVALLFCAYTCVYANTPQSQAVECKRALDGFHDLLVKSPNFFNNSSKNYEFRLQARALAELSMRQVKEERERPVLAHERMRIMEYVVRGVNRLTPKEQERIEPIYLKAKSSCLVP